MFSQLEDTICETTRIRSNWRQYWVSAFSPQITVKVVSVSIRTKSFVENQPERILSMSVPGFTADASFSAGKEQYNAFIQLVENSAILRLAGPIDLHNAVSEIVSMYPIGLFHPGTGNCLRRVCWVEHGWHGLPVKRCDWVVGWC